MTNQFAQYFKEVLPAIESKKCEFHLYGYTTANEEDIWIYCIQKKWRNKDIESMKIYEMVNDILKIKPAEFMTFTQIEAQRSSDWFSDLNSEELQLLLSPKSERMNEG